MLSQPLNGQGTQMVDMVNQPFYVHLKVKHIFYIVAGISWVFTQLSEEENKLFLTFQFLFAKYYILYQVL